MVTETPPPSKLVELVTEHTMPEAEQPEHPRNGGVHWHRPRTLHLSTVGDNIMVNEPHNENPDAIYMEIKAEYLAEALAMLAPGALMTAAHAIDENGFLS